MFLRSPDRLTLNTPFWPTLGPSAPRPGPGTRPGRRTWPKKIFGPPTKNVCKIFFDPKTCFLVSWMVFGPPGPLGTPLGPPTTGHENCHKIATKKQKKSKIFFCSKSLPDGSWMVLWHQNRLKTHFGRRIAPVWAHFVHKLGQK